MSSMCAKLVKQKQKQRLNRCNSIPHLPVTHITIIMPDLTHRHHPINNIIHHTHPLSQCIMAFQLLIILNNLTTHPPHTILLILPLHITTHPTIQLTALISHPTSIHQLPQRSHNLIDRLIAQIVIEVTEMEIEIGIGNTVAAVGRGLDQDPLTADLAEVEKDGIDLAHGRKERTAGTVIVKGIVTGTIGRETVAENETVPIIETDVIRIRGKDGINLEFDNH
ncbi:hypothetical protein BKA69DRAFT_85702 [Paraphysoderma sedebokerense]|nr:hypothetical protein BKA69DRAFT_85702 [Paraphysoderma sedebokerense]